MCFVSKKYNKRILSSRYYKFATGTRILNLFPRKENQNEIIIEKSRFICSVKRVNGEDEAKAFVSSIKEKYPDATHNCYAYIADENGFYIKFSDDGEPQGTAGMPMLEVLKNKRIFKRISSCTKSSYE